MTEQEILNAVQDIFRDNFDVTPLRSPQPPAPTISRRDSLEQTTC